MKKNSIDKISRNLLGMALAVAVAGGVASCNEGESMTPSTPNYIQFSDTLYVLPVADDVEYHNIPVVATKACDYDRTVAVEIIDATSNAIEGKHYSLKSNSITIPAMNIGTKRTAIKSQPQG